MKDHQANLIQFLAQDFSNIEPYLNILKIKESVDKILNLFELMKFLISFNPLRKIFFVHLKHQFSHKMLQEILVFQDLNIHIHF